MRRISHLGMMACIARRGIESVGSRHATSIAAASRQAALIALLHVGSAVPALFRPDIARRPTRSGPPQFGTDAALGIAPTDRDRELCARVAWTSRPVRLLSVKRKVRGGHWRTSVRPRGPSA